MPFYAKHYGILEENLADELHQPKRLIERKKQTGEIVSTTHDVLVLLEPYKEVFSDLHFPNTTRHISYVWKKLLLFTPLTISTSVTCGTEVEMFEPAIWASLQLVPQRTKGLSVDAVIDRFAASHKNRRIVLFCE